MYGCVKTLDVIDNVHDEHCESQHETIDNGKKTLTIYIQI